MADLTITDPAWQQHENPNDDLTDADLADEAGWEEQHDDEALGSPRTHGTDDTQRAAHD